MTDSHGSNRDSTHFGFILAFCFNLRYKSMLEHQVKNWKRNGTNGLKYSKNKALPLENLFGINARRYRGSFPKFSQ